MNVSKTSALVDGSWDESIVAPLMDYIRIPNKSPAFDPAWEAHGHMEQAVQLMRRWAEAHSLQVCASTCTGCRVAHRCC